MQKNRSTLCSISFVLFILACAGIGHAQDNDVVMAQAFVHSNEGAIDELKTFEKFQRLRDLAPAAYSAGDYVKAERFALKLQGAALDLANENKAYSSSTDYATHIGNTVLGLVALEKGDLSKAGDFLIAAGAVKSGYPALRTFGPNMLLAKKLLEKGEREAVLEYMDKCAGFWQLEDGRLAKWKETIKDGGVPDFGRNLRHQVSNWKTK